jgi:hypothetical protein
MLSSLNSANSFQALYSLGIQLQFAGWVLSYHRCVKGEKVNRGFPSVMICCVVLRKERLKVFLRFEFFPVIKHFRPIFGCCFQVCPTFDG